MNSADISRQTTAAVPIGGNIVAAPTLAAMLIEASRGSFGQIDFIKLSTKLAEAGPVVAALAAQSLTTTQQGDLARASRQDNGLTARANALTTTSVARFGVVGDGSCGGHCGDGDNTTPRPQPAGVPHSSSQPPHSTSTPPPQSTQIPPPPPTYVQPSRQLRTKVETELKSEASETEFKTMFGGTQQAKFNNLTSLTNSKSSSGDWAQALSDFKDNTLAKIPNQQARIFAAYELGLGEGFAGGIIDSAKAIGVMAVNTVKFATNKPLLGPVFGGFLTPTGNVVEDLYRLVRTGSAYTDDQKEAIAYAETIADNIDAYVSTRAKNPKLLKEDIRDFFESKWKELKDEHDAAKQKGPTAEAEWWGKTIGRAVFEIAMVVTVMADVIRIGRAATNLAKLAATAARDFTAAKIADMTAAANEMIASAKLAIRSGETAVSTVEDLEKVQTKIHEFELFTAKDLPDTAANRAIIKKMKEAELEVDKAIDKSHRIESPHYTPHAAGAQNTNVVLSGRAKSWITDLFDKNKAVQYKNSAMITINSVSGANLPTTADLAAMTRRYGEEFAIFKRGNEVVLINGDANGIDIPPALIASIKKYKDTDQPWVWVAHSQPGIKNSVLKASTADQNFLKLMGQDKSVIVNGRGQTAEFTQIKTFQNQSFVKLAKNPATAAEFNNAANNASALTRYVYDGYVYETDSLGRSEFFGGKLKLEAAGRNTRLQQAIGHDGVALGHPNDVGFHLIGDQFGGQTNRLNVVPGNGNLNNGAYAAFERTIKARAQSPNTEVEVQIRAVYKNGNTTSRPDQFVASYRSITRSHTVLHPQWTHWQTQTFNNT